MICQTFLTLFSGLAIWLVGRTDKWQRWGFWAGLASQPFWIYSAVETQQFGILILSLFYTYCWGKGVWNHWFRPTQTT